jgi:Flp pilus assembly CpaE family ATPase
MTGLEWSRVIAPVGGIHLLAANPIRRGTQPTWADYYQILQFTADRYDYIIVDLPEVINSATSELVRAARAIFITCTPEVPSLAMASLRASELEAFEIPRGKVETLLNRYERGALSLVEIERILGRPVFAVLPNDYREIKKAIIESRFVSLSSRFSRGCAALAQKISGLEQSTSTPSRFALLRRLSAITGIAP